MKRFYEELTKKVLLITFIVLFSMMGFAKTYYVSNAGADSNSGLTTSLAWKSITKVNATTFNAGDQILFNRGETFYGTLTPKNSGTSGNPIVYGAYGTGADPIITGFSTLTGWTNEGSSIYSKVISSLDEAQTNMVTVNGVQVGMARFPDATWLTYESFVTNTSITDNTLGDAVNWTGAEAVIQKNKFVIQREKITGHTLNTLIYSPHSWGGRNNCNYFIQNDLRCVTATNEWHHDFSGTGKFYIYGDPSAKTVNVATLNYLFYNNGYDYITIDGISFMGSIDNAVYCPYATNMTIQNCSVQFAGQDAIKIIGTARVINGNTISKCNRTAIYCQGSTGTITNNTINNIGLVYGQATDGSLCNGVSMDGNSYTVQNNTISNSVYNGITIQGGLSNITVKNNFIENACNSILTDGGGIYTPGVQTNILIDGNIVINSNSGIYMDEGSTGVTIQNNTVTDNALAGIKLHRGHYLSVINNTCYNNNSGIDYENWSGSLALHDNSITGNIFFAKNSTQKTIWIQSDTEDYLQFGTSDFNYITRPINETASIYSWVLNTGVYKTLDQWKTYANNDTNSKKSSQTITNINDLQFEYNATTTVKTVQLSYPMMDVKGAKYSTAITLQPYTSVVLMKDLTPAVVPGAPTSIVATAGNASASVTFVAPINNGGSAITGYTVTSIPAGGIDANAGSTSLTHSITGLTNGTSYTFTVKATNSAGTSLASMASNSVIPKAPVATSFQITGPSSGNVNSASANFTVAPNNLYTGTITITPSGAGSAGLSAKVLTFSGSSSAQTFTITPTVAGNITLTPSNNGSLSNPANLTYNVNAVVPDAPTSVVATAGDASASVTFIAPTNTGGTIITGYTVTSNPAGGTDTNAGSTSLTHSITGLANGTYTFTVKATNSVGASVPSVASNPIENVIIKQGEIVPSHFTPVWQGLNGLNHMNINVVSAILEDLPLSANDEIAVFCGSNCVGTTKLSQSIIPSDNTTFLTILASQSDGSNNGFIENDSILFKVWDNKNQVEMQINGVVYRNDVATWKTNGRYSPSSTAVVEIESYQVYTQSIELLKGYNMISTYLSAQNPNLSAVTKTLVDQGNLIKMQDETGNSFENWGSFGGWINQLGSLEETEGYKIQVTNNCTLKVTGRSIAMPFDISLKAGWNIISYPRTDMVNAMNVVQLLIDQNKLVKVQDEAGNSIENWGLFGGWKNGIGNLIPGKAYKIKMSADAILTFQESYQKSAAVIAKVEQTEYYHSSVEGNGTDHMNINITGLNNIDISVGDELAAFDGAVCVATTKITEANLLSGSACLVSSISTDSQEPNGFKPGNSIQISVWNKLSGDELKVNAEVITGQMKYEKNASVLVRMKSATIATAITNLDDVVKIEVFPNPCQSKLTVRFSELPEANSRIEISDISGRKLLLRQISGTSEEFNLVSFTPGLYLVKSVLGKNEYVQKLIVNK